MRLTAADYKTIIESSLDVVMLTRPDGIIYYLSPSCREVLGYEPAELVGRRPWIIHPDDLERAKAMHARALRGERGSNFMCRIVTKSGKTKWISHTFWPLLHPDGKRVRMVVSFVKDITEQKATQAALAEREQQYRVLADNVADVIWISDIDFRLSFVTPSVESLRGYTVEEVMGQKLKEILTPASYELAKRLFKEIIAAGPANHPFLAGTQPLELELTCKDGSTVWTEARIRVLRDEEGQAAGFVGVTRDVSARKRLEEELEFHRHHLQELVDQRTAELRAAVERLQQEIARRVRVDKALHATREMYRTVTKASPDMIAVLDERGRIVEVSDQAVYQLGFQAAGELIGRNCIDLVAPEDRTRASENLGKALAGSPGRQREYTLVRRDGTRFPVEMNTAPFLDTRGRPKGLIAVCRDVTVRKRMEAELRRAEKLESLGVLAGGIAHDFNNLLTPILTNLSAARIFGHLDEESSRLLEDAEKAALHAKRMTQQLLAFARGGAPVRKTASIAGLLREATSFALRGSNVRCEFVIPGDLWPVDMDEGQITQAVYNLALNADQAMPGGGRIEVSAANVRVGPQEVPGLGEGRYVRVRIRDEGPGIPEADRARIFDPFFTTKDQGSGLGLATTYAIIRRHDGQIRVESEAGAGAVFEFFLPASEGLPQSPDRTRVGPAVGAGRILLVDDDEMVRRSAGKALELLGYNVEFASNGSEGLDRYRVARDAGRPFDAVLLDLTIPGGLGGREAVRRFLAIDPDAKVICSSGYSHDPVMSSYREHGFSAVVAKPYDLQVLGDVVRKVVTDGQA